MLDFLRGKKTYLVAALAGLLAAAQSLGYQVPEELWPILGAVGLGTLRAGVSKSG